MWSRKLYGRALRDGVLHSSLARRQAGTSTSRFQNKNFTPFHGDLIRE